MASVDATSASGSFSASTNVSWSHTVGAGATALYVSVGFWDNAGQVSAVTWNGSGTGFTQVASADRATTHDRCEIWRLTNPTTGTHTIQVSFSVSGQGYGSAGAVSITGGDTSTPERTTSNNTATGSSTTPSASPTGAQSGDIVIDAMACTMGSPAQTITMTSHSGRTQIHNANTGAGGEGGAGSYMTSPADPQTMDWSFSTSNTWAICSVVAANAAGGGGGGATSPGWYSSRGGWL